MNNNEPNKIIKSIIKKLDKLTKDSDGGNADKYDWKLHDAIKDEFISIVMCVGAIEVMSKNTIIQMVALQGKLRAIPEHRFYIQFSKAAEDMRLL